LQATGQEWRVISLLFAPPESLAIHQLESTRYELDDLTGDAWDLFFAGYSKYVPGDQMVDGSRLLADGSNDPWCYNHQEENRLLEWVRQQSGKTFDVSGRGDLVSFVAYKPWTVDAFKIVPRILDSERNLGAVAEGLVGWLQDDVKPTLAPGQNPLGDVGLTESLKEIARLAPRLVPVLRAVIT
jgi:hypothetical protein